MVAKDALFAALKPLFAAVKEVDPKAPDASARIEALLPKDALQTVQRLVREGVADRTLAPRENGGVRFDRIAKPDVADGWAIDLVFMGSPSDGGGAEAGLGHTHPNGEIDLCFPVAGSPRFDGQGNGKDPCVVVYEPGSRHVPTVTGGTMDILYFLPGGAITFDPA